MIFRKLIVLVIFHFFSIEKIKVKYLLFIFINIITCKYTLILIYIYKKKFMSYDPILSKVI